ncbi:hypothetical protein, conserved [Trypanosoma brucei gambiense DAL972]|uniref:Uncharacterized protein n=1 Tax=Trypanosoma brucei gambiense (strain MHOM/CI/86/DAL972) TaxID=679716 RepID=C9ZMS1_TRYB9|nr:hypothetical protein, conserved [Trypanosoma brucei gambiense DAL972]CBH10574.1 hypothetical protein, conserved [Trypanosoma brucei gambiense DAL972]|eukprot:XP_011772863.1 hypothetical protein, conserved [Trypanosoma brucei gambiense DAL972]
MAVTPIEKREGGMEPENQEVVVQSESPREAARDGGSSLNSELKKVLNRRARYRTPLIFISLTSVVLMLTTLATSTIPVPQFKNNTKKRVVMIVAPSLRPDVLKLSIESNKAPFMNLVTAAGGNYLYTNWGAKKNWSVTSAPDMSRGSGWSEANGRSNSLKLLQELAKEGKRSIVLASSSDDCQSNKEEKSNNGGRRGVEILPVTTSSSELLEEDVLRAFERLTKNDGDLLYIHTGVGGGSKAAEGEGNAAAFDDINILDSMLKKLTIAVAGHSQKTAEKWLVAVVAGGGRGGNVAHEVSMLTSTYDRGNLLDSDSLTKDISSDCVQSTLLRWFGVREATAS